MSWRSKTHLFPVVEPRDCVVAFAIPTSLSRFNADFAQRKGYAWLCRTPARYRALLPELHKFEVRAGRLGVHLVHDLAFDTRYCLTERTPELVTQSFTAQQRTTLQGKALDRESFAAALGASVDPSDLELLLSGCRLTRYDELFGLGRVVVLFSHWEEEPEANRIEFSDAMVECAKVVEATPQDYPGLIDLAICRPPELVRGLRKKFRGRAVNRFIPEKLDPIVQLGLCAALLTHLGSRRQSYEEAWAQTCEDFLRAL